MEGILLWAGAGGWSLLILLCTHFTLTTVTHLTQTQTFHTSFCPIFSIITFTNNYNFNPIKTSDEVYTSLADKGGGKDISMSL